MYGNGMTGEHTFRRSDRLIKKQSFLKLLDSMMDSYKITGPVLKEGQTIFMDVNSSKDLFMEYKSTMLSPGKLFFYKPKEDLFRFRLGKKISIEEISPSEEKRIIVGVHPCDTSAIFYLDRTFLGAFKDPNYNIRRKNTIIISLNCTSPSENCFCSSVGTGPFLKAGSGYDLLLTDLGDEYLAEIRSLKAAELFGYEGKKAGGKELNIKSEKEKTILKKFKKSIDLNGLDDIFMRNMDHPLWQQTADEKCLSCSNCVMVCPTCFCYDMVDETGMDMRTVTRSRRFDACQDVRFAEVHGGNFRQRRASRLRQFVTHKLNQKNQYGVLGTVGCGRCITWCPTSIDLTEIALGIRKGSEEIIRT